LSTHHQDDLDELIAEFEAQSPGFAERVEVAYQERVEARERAASGAVEVEARASLKREAS